MKKHVFTMLFLACIAISGTAQIEQGTFLLGAKTNAGFNFFNEDAGDYSQFNIELKGGYFVIENLTLGLNLGFSSISEGDASLNVSEFGLFGRYYINGKIFGGIGYSSQKTKYDFGFGDGESTTSIIPIELGYAAFINDVIAIEPALNYTIYGSDSEGASFGINIGISIYLGRGGN
jgi:hypothetical protein